MTDKYVQDGSRIPHVATAAVAANALIKTAGDLHGVSAAAAVTGGIVNLAVEGVFNLPKKAAASTSWVQGGPVYALATGGVNKLTGLSTSATLVGTGWAAAATGDTTGKVKLLGFHA